MQGAHAAPQSEAQLVGPCGNVPSRAKSKCSPMNWMWRVKGRTGPVAVFLKLVQTLSTHSLHTPSQTQTIPHCKPLTNSSCSYTSARTLQTSSNCMQCWKHDLVNKPWMEGLQQAEPNQPCLEGVKVTKWQTKLPDNKKPNTLSCPTQKTLLLACQWFIQTASKFLLSLSLWRNLYSPNLGLSYTQATWTTVIGHILY